MKSFKTMSKMKKYTNYVISILALVSLNSCIERDEDNLVPAGYPSDGEVFIDGFSLGLNYAAFGGSKVTAFDVDTEVKYEGTTSMKISVPDAGDPEGAYAGGVYYTEIGRDLSGYNVLTFWAKASKAASIDLLGFGNDLGESKLLVTLPAVAVNTNWKKYYIPIPNPSVVTQERGMFFYSEGPEEGLGYTFWIDELKFENLGTIAHPKYAMFNGQNRQVVAETGETIALNENTVTFNLPTGVDQTVGAAPGYFSFTSSDENVAIVDSLGNVAVIGEGSASILATAGGEPVEGSLSVEAIGAAASPEAPAPAPTKPSNEVISIFSNAYTDEPVDFYNGYWEFSTTESFEEQIDGDDVIRYRNLNFVGIQFTAPTINISAMTHFNMDIWTPDATAGSDFKILLVDLGPDGSFGGDDDSSHEITITDATLQTESWVNLDLPLTSFPGLTGRSNLAQIVLSSATISNVYVDNIYFYAGEVTSTGPTVGAPAPTQATGDVISLFSDAYTDVTVDSWRTDWSVASFSDVEIAGNPTKLYAALDFVGIETVSNQVDASAMTHFHVDVWSGDFTQFSIKLVDFGADGAFDGGDDTEHQIDFASPTTGEWISYDIPLTDFTGLTSTSNIAQYIFVGQPSGVTSVYIDNMYFHRGSTGTGPTEPEEGAPVPTQAEADVISLFSDTYTDVTVDTWRTDWSSATLEDVTIVDNPAKKYSDLDFVGIETVASQLNITEMTHLHIDVWSADFTQFSIKLVDFGADGAFDGGDDTEHQLDFATPSQGQWVSFDIPLSDFTGLTGKSNLAQYILVGQPTGQTTVFIDNFYFYK